MTEKRINIPLCIGAGLALLAVCSLRPAYAEEPSKQIVKVAYYDMGDYYKEIGAGVVESYDTAVLNKVEKYSDFAFEYVDCGSWANALQMLDRHEVDLVGTVQWTAERETQYDFCLESYGYTVGELSALPDSGFIYEDYDAIGRAVIGCVDPYVRMDAMNQMFAAHGITPTMKYYTTQAELQSALESGEVDLIAANSHTLKDDYVAVEKFAFAPFFFVSWKGNSQLTDRIDDAIISMNIQEPGADDTMMQEYFSAIIGTPLTKAERNLIAEDKVYDVYFDATTKPLSWYDAESGTMQGGLTEVCRQISASTGLKLNPMPMFAGETKLDGAVIRTTTVYNGANESLFAKRGETHALLEEEFNFYYQVDHQIDLKTNAFTVAIVANRVHLKDYIRGAYPNATIQECATPTACLKAVEAGEADLAYLDCRIADNTMAENGIENVKEFPTEPQSQGIALMFPEGETQDLLVSIINKGLEQVNQDDLSDYFVRWALTTKKPVTLKSIIRDYFGWVTLAIGLLALILICFAVSLTYAMVMKKQRDKIEKADADRTEFFGRMSHDMRTPMNGILGMIELSETTDSMVEVRDNLHKAKAAGEYMLSLINDTLDLQRLESQKLQLEKNIVHVKDYYDDIFSIMRVSAEQKNIAFDVKYSGIDLDGYVELDAVRVKQIFSNLISNAIKFTPDGGAVEVVVEATGQDGDLLHRKYRVRDTGVGMSEDFIKNRLFKPYSQENNQLSTQLTGSGLGMAITKNLVETMGGRLEVESALGEGTTYTVYLELKRATKEEAEKTAQQQADETKIRVAELAGKQILLCEDHPLNAEITKRLLEKVGCTVEWAENGQLGVACFAQAPPHKFDAILMDVRMPVMDGMAAAKAIRKLGKGDAATIPIIAMTANAYESDIRNCLDAGMNAHLAKPVVPQKLYEILYTYTVTKA